jgi:K+-transporting ATPase ATPase C chain
MKEQIRASFLLLLALTVLTGLVYPLAVTGIAQVLFADAANGSLILRGGKAVGSRLIGQPFADPKYFWSRLSATSPMAYNAASSTGSNLAPTNPALVDAAKARIDALKKADPGNTALVPVDLVTASGSGLDPHISPAAAAFQVARVAKARGLDEAQVRRVVEQNTEGPTFGVLGEARVNVLRLNLDLDAGR